jgi:hypothetical protein
MKLHFDPGQQFQIDAIKFKVGIFEGNDQIKITTALQLKDAGIEFKPI